MNHLVRELLLVRPSLNPNVLREENWRARRAAILISVPRPSSLISTIGADSSSLSLPLASPNTRHSGIVLCLDGSIEIQENSSEPLRLARKSLQRSSSTANSSKGERAILNGKRATFTEWENEHQKCIEIQDMFISLYLVNRDLWRYAISFL
jgi:hypothetical protein